MNFPNDSFWAIIHGYLHGGDRHSAIGPTQGRPPDRSVGTQYCRVRTFRDSSMVEQLPVKELVPGSSPGRGAL